MSFAVARMTKLKADNMGIHLPDKFLERAGLKEPSKKAPESSQKLDRHKSDELGGPHL